MKISILAWQAVACLALPTCGATAPAALPAGHAPTPAVRKTDWLYNARWGVMAHFTKPFLASDSKAGPIDARQWDRIIADFDVQGLSADIHQCGAGYLLLAARHGEGPPVAPNSVIEKTAPGLCPHRDLIGDLAAALHARGLSMMLYYSTRMGVDKPRRALESVAVLREWSLRYGKKIKGWWLDNNSGDPALQKLLAAACRAGNPGALVAFSPPHGPRRNSPLDDYTAGDTHDLGSVHCNGRFVDGAQWQALTFLGHTWGGYSQKGFGPRYEPRKAAALTARAICGGGVVTWDVRLTRQGRIAAEYLPALTAIGRAAKAAR